jgi:hypothetical protein
LPFIAMVAGALWIGDGAPRWASERTVDLSLEAPESVVRVDLDVGAHGEDPAFAKVWNFERGTAPASLSARFSVPDGAYEVRVVVEGSSGARRSRVHRVDFGDASSVRVHAH